jgi:hypothetical protein
MLNALICLSLAGVSAAAMDTEKAFGPETPTGRYKHPAAITELASGDLYLACYGGDGEYAPNTAVYGAQKERATGKWTAAAMIAQDPFHSAAHVGGGYDGARETDPAARRRLSVPHLP